jgi:hypothetical protein
MHNTSKISILLLFLFSVQSANAFILAILAPILEVGALVGRIWVLDKNRGLKNLFTDTYENGFEKFGDAGSCEQQTDGLKHPSWTVAMDPEELIAISEEGCKAVGSLGKKKAKGIWITSGNSKKPGCFEMTLVDRTGKGIAKVDPAICSKTIITMLSQCEYMSTWEGPNILYSIRPTTAGCPSR